MKDTDQQLIETELAERVTSEILEIPDAPNKPAAQEARKHLVNTIAVAARALRARGDSVVDKYAIASLLRSPTDLESLMEELEAGPERNDLTNWLSFYRDESSALNFTKMRDDLSWIAHYLENRQ